MLTFRGVVARLEIRPDLSMIDSTSGVDSHRVRHSEVRHPVENMIAINVSLVCPSNLFALRLSPMMLLYLSPFSARACWQAPASFRH